MAADSYADLPGAFVSARKLFGEHAVEKLQEVVATLAALQPNYTVFNLEPPIPPLDPIITNVRSLMAATQEHYVNRDVL